MCGRYELSSHPDVIALAFGLRFPPDITPRYNIAPTQQVPIIRQNAAGERELVQMRWGLVPRWAKDPSIGTRMINARGESITSKYAYRNAFARHRCLVPANGFYEWQTTDARRQPMHVGMDDGRPFGLAGLYERWLSPEGEVLDTCTIVTTQANASLERLHNRMPVIIADADYEHWLDTGTDDVTDLLTPWSGDALRVYPVSMRVNAVRNDDAALRDPIPMDEPMEADGRSRASVRTDGAAPEPVDDAEEEVPEPVQARLF